MLLLICRQEFVKIRPICSSITTDVLVSLTLNAAPGAEQQARAAATAAARWCARQAMQVKQRELASAQQACCFSAGPAAAATQQIQQQKPAWDTAGAGSHWWAAPAGRHPQPASIPTRLPQQPVQVSRLKRTSLNQPCLVIL